MRCVMFGKQRRERNAKLRTNTPIGAGNGMECHTGTCLAGLKPYRHFFSAKYHTGMLQG